LNRLASETARLRSEDSQLRQDLQTTEYANVNLGNQNEGKDRKLKDANEKVRNAEEVAGKRRRRKTPKVTNSASLRLKGK
jgi:hypothetical protein